MTSAVLSEQCSQLWPPIASSNIFLNKVSLRKCHDKLLSAGASELCDGLTTLVNEMGKARWAAPCSSHGTAVEFLRDVPASLLLLPELDHLPLWLRLGAARCILEIENSSSSHLQAAAQAPIQQLVPNKQLSLASMIQVKSASEQGSCIALLNSGLTSSGAETRAAAYRMAGSLAGLSIPIGRRAMTILMKRCLVHEQSDIALAAGIAVVCELPAASGVTSTQLRKWAALMLPKVRGLNLEGQGSDPGFSRSFAVLTHGICQWCLVRVWSPSGDADSCFMLLLRHTMAHQIQSLSKWQQEAKSMGRDGLSSWTLTTPLSILLQAVTCSPDEYGAHALLCRCLVRLGGSVLSVVKHKTALNSESTLLPTSATPAEQQSALLHFWCGQAVRTAPGSLDVGTALVRMLASLLNHAWLLAACDEGRDAGFTAEPSSTSSRLEPLSLLERAMWAE